MQSQCQKMLHTTLFLLHADRIESVSTFVMQKTFVGEETELHLFRHILTGAPHCCLTHCQIMQDLLGLCASIIDV